MTWLSQDALTQLRGREFRKTHPKLDLPTALAPDMAELLQSGDFSDFAITCKDVSFKVHKNLLSVQSPYFKTLVGEGFAEGATGVAEFKETTPLAVAMLISIMYLGRPGAALDVVYELWSQKFSQPVRALQNTDSSTSALNEFFELEFKTLVEVYVLADRCLLSHIATPISDYIVTYLESNLLAQGPSSKPGVPAQQSLATALRQIYTTVADTDENLRVRVTSKCILHMGSVVSKKDALKVIEEFDAQTWKACKMVARGLKEKHNTMLDAHKVDYAQQTLVSQVLQEWSSQTDKELWRSF